MQQVIKIIKELENTGSRNDKIRILKRHQDNELLKKVLVYTYDYTKVYGVGKKSLEGILEAPTRASDSQFINIFGLLDFLTKNNLNNAIKASITNFLMNYEKDERELYIRMMLKDLRIGATVKTINEAYESLLPQFETMLAKKYEDFADKIQGKQMIITTKLDGYRLIILKEGNDVKMISRQGKIIDGCLDIESEMLKLPDGAYDGELLKINPDKLNSKELYQETKKIAGKKGIKKDLEFHCFDYMSVEEFKANKCELPCLSRKGAIHNMLKENEVSLIKEVPILCITNDQKRIKPLLDEAIENGEEGIMVNLAYSKYDFKRSNNLLKVKQFYSMDLEIIGFEEGQGRNKGTLGAVLLDYKGNVVKCGSGYSDSERKHIYENQDEYLGKIAEINYFEITTAEKSGLDSLRFPTWNGFRLEKTKNDISFD